MLTSLELCAVFVHFLYIFISSIRIVRLLLDCCGWLLMRQCQILFTFFLCRCCMFFLPLCKHTFCCCCCWFEYFLCMFFFIVVAVACFCCDFDFLWLYFLRVFFSLSFTTRWNYWLYFAFFFFFIGSCLFVRWIYDEIIYHWIFEYVRRICLILLSFQFPFCVVVTVKVSTKCRIIRYWAFYLFFFFSDESMWMIVNANRLTVLIASEILMNFVYHWIVFIFHIFFVSLPSASAHSWLYSCCLFALFFFSISPCFSHVVGLISHEFYVYIPIVCVNCRLSVALSFDQ